MSTSSAPEILDNGLPVVHRLITDHDSSKKAVYTDEIPSRLPWQHLQDGANFCLAYATNKTPVPMNDSQDVKTYGNYLVNKPGIMIPGGTVLRYVDIAPGYTSPMHRTVSLDYGVVVEGEVWLVLDSGEERLLRRGDVAIQRGTNHAWRNNSKREWARMLYFLQEAEPLKVGGEELSEDYGGIQGVRASKAL